MNHIPKLLYYITQLAIHVSFFCNCLQKQWTLRLESIPRRIYISFLKYHAIVLVMRLYEHIASQYVTEEVLDKLTTDTFECAKRTAKTEDGGRLFKSMFTACWKANTISFLADYSVHQLILGYGYYIYIKEKRRRIKHAISKPDELNLGSVALSFIRKSSLLVVSRGVSLYFSSLGGALGTTVWPGWGTLAGTNLGDSLSLSLIDDIQSPTIE
jgi:hypothetical protein